MDEQRVSAYLALIQELLDCPNEANDVLNRHSDLVDGGFVEVCAAVAAQLQGEGQENQAGFLRDVAQGVGAFEVYEKIGQNQQETLENFWEKLLKANMQGGATAVHQVMRQNMELIIPAFKETIVQSVPRLLTQNPNNTQGVATLIEQLCICMMTFPDGQYAEILEIAIQGYGIVFTLQANSAADQARILLNRGSAQLTQAKMGINPVSNLQKVIIDYDKAAKIQYQLGLYNDLSITFMNRGTVHLTQSQIGIDSVSNLQKAITDYNKAAKIQHQLGLHKNLATTLNNLGNALLDQAGLGIDSASNLQKAITNFNEAAKIQQQRRLEKDLSSTLNNRGNAHQTQAKMGINPAMNLEQAIIDYSDAAVIMQRLSLHKDFAQTLMNRGNARQTQADMNITPIPNLQKAITDYNLSATIRQQLKLDQDLAQTFMNRGNAHLTQAELNVAPATNLQKAITDYNSSATIRQHLKLEKALSQTFMNRGNARLYQSKMGIDPAINLQWAITDYKHAVTIQHKLALEKDISTTLNNLGAARRTQAGMGIDPAANLQRAITDFDASAAIMQQLGLTRDLANTWNNFGFAYQVQSRLSDNSSDQKHQALENAYRSFRAALTQVEALRGEIGADSEAYKRNFNEEWNKVYRGMVAVCLELGRKSDALEYVDRSKARNLVELMAIRDAYPEGVISAEDQQRLNALKTAIFLEERRLQTTANPDPTHLNHLRQEKQHLEPYKPLQFNAMQGLLDDETAILEWYILGDQFLTFTLTRHTLKLWTFPQEDLDQLIAWGETYYNAYRTRNKSQWRETLAQRLAELPPILHLNEILATLFDILPTCQKLILIPHRYLHLFPLHALPVTQDASIAPLQDYFPQGITYAPNCQLLQQAQQRPRPHFDTLFAIQNPTQDLQFTDLEVEAIQALFHPAHILKHDQADKAAIHPETLKNTHCAHFSCHGYFNFENALKSALILANSEFPPPPPTDDPTRYLPLQNNTLLDLQKCLTLEDIFRFDLQQCRLVTLSACETGITDLTSTTDEYIGLPSGFLLSGVPNVISTLWAVNDLSTALLMIRFYHTLKHNEQTVPVALRDAQTWLRNASIQDMIDWANEIENKALSQRIKEEFDLYSPVERLESGHFSSPFWWAAFCAIGA
jgi:CHAT domain-containing protein